MKKHFAQSAENTFCVKKIMERRFNIVDRETRTTHTTVNLSDSGSGLCQRKLPSSANA